MGDDLELRSPNDLQQIARLALVRPLDLGLEIEPDIYFPMPTSISLGDPSFDRQFWIAADEPERARAIASSDLRRHVLATSEWARVSIADAWSILRKKPWVKPRLVSVAIRELRALAALIEAGRERCPLPAPLAPSEAALEGSRPT